MSEKISVEKLQLLADALNNVGEAVSKKMTESEVGESLRDMGYMTR